MIWNALALFLFPFALAAGLIGAALLFIGFALIYINHFRKIARLRILIVICFIIGALSFLPALLDVIFWNVRSEAAVSMNLDKMGPFLAAVESGDQATMSKLLAQGTDINATYPDYNNTTALLQAVHNSDYETVTFLLDNGADINQIAWYYPGSTPLLDAVYCDESENRGDMNMVELLLKRGADVTIKSGRKFKNITALEQSSLYSVNTLNMDLLIHYGSDVNVNNGAPLRNAVYMDVQSKKIDRMPFVRLLVEHGAKLDFADENGMIPFDSAAASGETEIVKYLMQFDHQINRLDAKGRTPLISACSGSYSMSGKLTMVELLISDGADINIVDRSGKTAMDYLLSVQNINGLVDYMRSQGAKTAAELN